MKQLALAFMGCLIALPGLGAEKRVIAVGGAVTEIVYALEQDHLLIGRDTTSSHPAEAEALPDVGYMRALSPEGVLSLGPDLILAAEGAGPPETIAVLKDASVEMVTIPEGYDAEGIATKITTVGAALGVAPRAEALAEDIRAQLAAAEQAIAAREGDKPRVVFVISARGGRIMAAGEDTGAAAIIALAGGENALSGFSGYKPVSDEALLAAAPDIILAMNREGDHAISADNLATLPALAATPAGQAGRVVRMDGLYLLGFGPRTPQAVRDLNVALEGS